MRVYLGQIYCSLVDNLIVVLQRKIHLNILHKTCVTSYPVVGQVVTNALLQLEGL